jgi:putative ABC transport system permease protein
VLISFLGSGVGLLIGAFFGWAIAVVVRDEGFGAVTLPYVSLMIILVLAVLGGVIAAIRPARRAARLDVLQAIATS